MLASLQCEFLFLEYVVVTKTSLLVQAAKCKFLRIYFDCWNVMHSKCFTECKKKKKNKTVKLLMRLEFHAKLDIACFCFWHYHKWMVEWAINVLHLKPNNSNNKTHVTRNTQKGEFLLSSCHQPCARTWAVILSVAHSLFCRCLWSEEVRHMPWEFPAMFFSWFDSWPVLFHGLT